MLNLFSKEETLDMLFRQLSSFYKIGDDEKTIMRDHYDQVIGRLDVCLSGFADRKYNSVTDANGIRQVQFNPMHSSQWAMFLYFYSNTLFANISDHNIYIYIYICSAIYGLCKTMAGVDLFYEVNLPDIFSLDHPVGSVMGRAEYGDYFSFAQGCTVGNNHGVYPIIGGHVTMHSDSKILGRCRIGDYVTLAANTYIKDQDIPPHSLVFGQSPNLIIKGNRV
jgi:serine O-acetyltransferase